MSIPAILAQAADEVSFQMMRGLLGWSDQSWSLAVQMLGLATAFLIGGLGRSRRGILAALAVGLAANVIGQLFIAGGGPGFCVGLVLLPVFCAMSYGVGRVAARWIRPRLGRPTRA